MHRKQLVINIKQCVWGWGDGSVGIGFSMQAKKPEFRPSTHIKILLTVVPT